jgi:hypothetical protein
MKSSNCSEYLHLLSFFCHYSQASLQPSRLNVPSRSFYHSAPSLWNTLPKEFRQFNSTHSKCQPLLSSCHLLNFKRNLKLTFSCLLFQPNLVFHLDYFSGFLPWLFFFIHSHFHLSFTLNSFTAFYFMAQPSIQCC